MSDASPPVDATLTVEERLNEILLNIQEKQKQNNAKIREEEEEAERKAERKAALQEALEAAEEKHTDDDSINQYLMGF